MEQFKKLKLLASKVVNPLPALADGAGLRSSPYQLRLRSGIAMELRPRIGDLFGFYEILLRDDYFSAGQVLRPGATVVDVGANIGCFALAASRRVGPSGRVLAIEPDLATYQQLVRNIALNSATNITALHLAVGGEEGTANLRTAENRLFSSLFASVNGQEISGKEQTVPMTTLALLFKSQRVERVHYLKLDCEGAEHPIIETLTSDTAAIIDQITMEVHRVPGHDFGDLERRLFGLGFGRVGSGTLPFYRRSGVC